MTTRDHSLCCWNRPYACSPNRTDSHIWFVSALIHLRFCFTGGRKVGLKFLIIMRCRLCERERERASERASERVVLKVTHSLPYVQFPYRTN